MSLTYQISTSAMIAAIEKLHLERGDILICRRVEALEYLQHLKAPVDFTVPVVFLPSGSVDKLSRQDLLNLLEQTEQEAIPDMAVESPTAPV